MIKQISAYRPQIYNFQSDIHKKDIDFSSRIKNSPYNKAVLKGLGVALIANGLFWALDNAKLISFLTDQVLTYSSGIVFCLYVIVCNKVMKH